MIATTENVLTEAFADAIIALVPRLLYKGAEGWKSYDRERSLPSRTRAFRILWTAGGLQPGGAMFGHIFEHWGECRIRTDYAGEHAKQQHIIIDDFHQVGDALTVLKDASESNGIVVVERLAPRPVRGEPTENDVVRVDHTYKVRYMRSIRL